MPENHEKAIDTVARAFRWFNRVGAREIELIREGVEAHFHSDSSIMIDRVMKGVGIEGFQQRFQEMLDKLNWWRASQPFELYLSEGDKAAARYQYEYEDKAGERGVIDIVAIWTVRDGKVLATVENATYHGPELSLDSYT